MMCRFVNLSRSTFIRKFGQVCHCSPIHYLMEYRVLQAQRMIGEGLLNRTQIAHECGFYDLSHMEKYLKKANH